MFRFKLLGHPNKVRWHVLDIQKSSSNWLVAVGEYVDGIPFLIRLRQFFAQTAFIVDT